MSVFVLPRKAFPWRGRLEKQSPFFGMWFFDSLENRGSVLEPRF